MSNRERRGYEAGLEVRKADDGSAVIEGHAAVFDSLSQDLGGFRERVAPGAFADSLAEPDADVLAFWNHDSSQVLGRTPRTLRVWEDDQGLAFELKVPEARQDVLESIQRGDVRGVSFGFRTREDKWEKVEGEDRRTLVSVDLIEISPTPLPAYKATDVAAALRSLNAWHEEEQRELAEWRKRKQRLIERTYGG